MGPKSYEVSILPRAMKELGAIPRRDHEAVIGAILGLAGNPRPRGTKKLRGGDLWRLRVGDYRILYTIQDKRLIVVVVRVGHRREAYR